MSEKIVCDMCGKEIYGGLPSRLTITAPLDSMYFLKEGIFDFCSMECLRSWCDVYQSRWINKMLFFEV